ncbi:JAB domain-containing protein [Enterobacteriaceae bacterium LUAb1]
MEIPLGKNDKRTIEGTDDVYGIMQRILLRENKIDQEKEHFWIIGMNGAGYILYIELVALGTFRSVNVEPMNIYRIAVMKNASRVIAVHNHPSGRLQPSETDLDTTDCLIQVGRILNIEFVDHLIITPVAYLSFRGEGVMDKLEASLKYVPTYQIIENIRKEEKKIAREKLALEKDKTKAAQEKTKQAREAEKIEKERREKLEQAMVTALLNKDVSIEDIAKIMDVTPKAVEKIINKK